MKVAHCPYCDKEFMIYLDAEIGKAIYWHIRSEHGLNHDQAFEAAGDAMENTEEV